MTRGERTWLFVGVLIGLAATLLAFVVMYRTPVAEPVRIDQTHEPQVAPVLPEASPTVVQLTTSEQEKIRLQTTTIRRDSVSAEIVTSARVEELGTATRTISTGVAGRIDHLLVNSIGQLVSKGQPVALIDSPELIAAAEQYRSAIEDRRQLEGGQHTGAPAQADALVDASRRRLEMWGLRPDEIREIIASPRTPIHVTIYSESAGIVRTQNVAEGRYVVAGEVLMVLTDLNTVWVKADIFESDIGRIHLGLGAQIVSEALPGIKLSGEVNFIDSRSDPQTGTTPVRIQLQNPGMRLKPGMFVRCVLQAPLGSNVLTVPRTAVIDTGTDRIVYVALDKGMFQRRSIQVGAPGKDHYPVVEGLVEGDKVVTNGAFLIDSQARLTGGMTRLFGGSRSFSESAAPSRSSAGSAYSVTFRISPEPPAAGKDNSGHVTLLDSSGKPVSDAQVRITAIMPAMPSMGMPEMRHSTDLQWHGSEYLGAIRVGMAGPWNVVVEARRGDQLLATYQTHFDAH